MAKGTRILTTMALGAIGGAALTIFLASKTGKTVKEKALSVVKDYQENSDEIYAEWGTKAQKLREEAVARYQEVKEQLEAGDLTYETVLQTSRDRVLTLGERASQRLSSLREQLDQSAFLQNQAYLDSTEDSSVSDKDQIVVSETIEIDLQEK